MRKFLIALILLPVLLLFGCSNHTTGATNVTATSATLNASGVCDSGQTCTVWGEYRKVGTTDWNGPVGQKTIVGNGVQQAGSGVASPLTPQIGYEYRVCGTQTNVGGTWCFDHDGKWVGDGGTNFDKFTTLALPPCANVLYCGDFETGDYSQYWQRQWIGSPDGYTASQVGNSSAHIVSSPVTQGSHASRCTVAPNTGSANDRCENVTSQSQAGGYPGQEWYYGWSINIPGPSQDWWHQGGDWNDITQFGSNDNSGGWIYFNLDAETGYVNGPDQTHPTIKLNTAAMGSWYMGTDTWTKYTGRVTVPTIQYDHWYHFVFHTLWSTDPSVGFLELWVDGKHVIPLTHGQTLKNTTVAYSGFTSPGTRISQGIYRGPYTSTNNVVDDGLCRAATYAAAAAC